MISGYPQRGEDKLTSQRFTSAQEFLRPKMAFADWQAFFEKIEVVKTVARFMYGTDRMKASDLLAIYNRLTERNFWNKCPGCGE